MPSGYHHPTCEQRRVTEDFLRRCGKKRKRPDHDGDGRGVVRGRVDTGARLRIVEDKGRTEGREIDTVTGGRHRAALVSMVDRASTSTFPGLVASISGLAREPERSQHCAGADAGQVSRIRSCTPHRWRAPRDSRETATGIEVFAGRAEPFPCCAAPAERHPTCCTSKFSPGCT